MSLKEKAIEIGILKLLEWIKEEKPFGFIEKTAPINFNGKNGLLVWDYVVWNELTFVDSETKTKTSLYTNISDKATKEQFDELVEKYGV